MSTSVYQSTTRRCESVIGGVTVKIEISSPARDGDTGAVLWDHLSLALNDGARAAGERVVWSRITERDVTETVSQVSEADIIDFSDEFACRNLDGEAVA